MKPDKSRPPARRLTEDDKSVWEKVARSVRPLRREHKRRILAASDKISPEGNGQAAPAGKRTPPKQDKPRQKRPLLPPISPPAGAFAAGFGVFDRSTYRKLEQKRLPIDARLDLHDHSQQEAHDALLHFISQASRRGLRHVLIITGKGSARQSGGVLQKQVPHWLAAAAFRPYVAAISSAPRPHGGAGAFYLRLRKNKA